jgi:NhaA family Na+:H+ antiporter
VVIGLVLGKPVGISAFAWLACRLGVAALPDGTNWAQLVGMAALGGIGFTVSLFITELAFESATLAAEAKLAVLASSVLASGIGAFLLSRNGPAEVD